jgi:FKBP-type peptidyl-prolyl cis-trans isomerase SlyD
VAERREVFLTEEIVVKDNWVVQLDYKLTVDGDVVDTTDPEDREPIEFIQGQGQIISGLETELYGMAVGESRHVEVKAEDGYGDIDDEAFITVERSDFPDSIPVEVGTVFEMREPEGDLLLARIIGIEGDEISVDLNHPLAGKDLHFDVTVLSLRAATPEELDHGHVHSHGAH